MNKHDVNKEIRELKAKAVGKDEWRKKNIGERNLRSKRTFEIVKKCGQELRHNITHYTNVPKRKRIKARTKTSRRKIGKTKKQQREIKERTLEREHQLETKQLTLEEKRMKIAMKERITIECLKLEQKKLETEEKIQSRKETNWY